MNLTLAELFAHDLLDTADEPTAVSIEQLRRRCARAGTEAFTRYTWPGYLVNWHHEILFGYLDKFASAKIKRLMIFEPPRHGKTEQASIRTPAFILGKDPNCNIMGWSHSQEKASEVNRFVQRVIDEDRYYNLFPKTQLWGPRAKELAKRRGQKIKEGTWQKNNDRFDIVGHKGSYRSMGIGASSAGYGFQKCFIDDPISGSDEALSPTKRDKAWERYIADIYTRQAPNAGICLIQTRWHEDDLAGRLIKQGKDNPSKLENWTIICLPARYEPDHPLLIREDRRQRMGDPLWPERYGEDFLIEVERNGDYQFASLYQQRPYLREGGLFKPQFFADMIIGAAPIGASRVRYWDKAATADGGCFTCGVLMAMTPDRRFYIEHVVRGQWSPHERDEVILATTQADKRLYPSNPPHNWIEREPGSSGIDAADVSMRKFVGHYFRFDRVTGSKEERANGLSSQCEGHNVFLVQSQDRPWEGTTLDKYLSELYHFPRGQYADQVDASSGAFTKLHQGLGSRVEGDLVTSASPEFFMDRQVKKFGVEPDDPREDSFTYNGIKVNLKDPQWGVDND